MIKDDKLFDEIKQFVYSIRWRYKQVLSRDTRLFEDLKIDGDDAVDFFTAFEKEFNVDVSNFKIERYFNGEGFDPIGLSKLLRWIKGQKEIRSYNKNTPINLGHLEKAIKAGRLDEEIING